MKIIRSFVFCIFYSVVLVVTSGSCFGQTKTTLAPVDYRLKMNEMPNAPVIDVRTPEEFSKGHLDKAINLNWNNADFVSAIGQLDKTKPVFVYCLSGGRSGAAAAKMRSLGFHEVYEMEGGMIRWRAAKMPEVGANASPGMSRKEYDALVEGDQIVLVDFYADWCAPCKKMEPYLAEIKKEMAGRVVVVRLNADENRLLTKELKVDALPKLIIYREKKIQWEHTGYMSKEDIVKQLK